MVDQSEQDISDCKGLSGVAMATKFCQNRPKITKMAITSVVCNISMHSLVFDRVCAIGEFISGTRVHKGQRGVTMATNFGTKIAIHAYKCISMRDSENVITYNRGFSWSTNPNKTFLIARV